jgi:hypothetical protein
MVKTGRGIRLLSNPPQTIDELWCGNCDIYKESPKHSPMTKEEKWKRANGVVPS